MNFTTPLAAATLMMWIVWSDSVRKRASSPLLYSFRVVLYLGATSVLLYLLWRDRLWTSRSVTALTLAAALVGLGGAWYFFRRARPAGKELKPRN